jgi:hypothetical protein
MALPFSCQFSILHEAAILVENLKLQKAARYKPFIEKMVGGW